MEADALYVPPQVAISGSTQTYCKDTLKDYFKADRWGYLLDLKFQQGIRNQIAKQESLQQKADYTARMPTRCGQKQV